MMTTNYIDSPNTIKWGYYKNQKKAFASINNNNYQNKLLSKAIWGLKNIDNNFYFIQDYE